MTVGIFLFFQPRWMVNTLASRSPGVLFFVETDEPMIALTIDDGPSKSATPGILDVLSQHDARATFFLISSRVTGNESVVADMVERGHELGNHLTEDRRSVRLSPAEFEEKLLEAHAVLSPFAPVRWFRPGGGWFKKEMIRIASARDYQCVLGTFYPSDVPIPWPDFTARHVLENVRPGAIIILHDGEGRGARTIEVLETILPELNRRGYRVVTVSELVEQTR